MFPKNFFSISFFAPTYFAPADGVVVPPVDAAIDAPILLVRFAKMGVR